MSDLRADLQRILPHVGMNVEDSLEAYVQRQLKSAWDSGWDAGNFYAIDDFNRGYKTKNPYKSES